MTENGKGPNGKNGKYTTKQFIDAIPGTGGIISAIAKRVGCAWHTANRYIRTYATVRQAYDNEFQTVGDMLETAALSQAKEGDGRMLRFMLSTKWKARGYDQAVTLRGDENAPLVIRWVNDWRDPTPDAT